LWVVGLLAPISGCAGQPQRLNGVDDPLRPVNGAVFEFNRGLHRLVVLPAVDIYGAVTPDLVETGINNFFSNLGYLHVIANDLLQGRFEHAGRDTGRLAINTTLGVGGLFDPATDMGLPARRQNFGVTAARWGVPPGPYLVLPLVGPHTLRSLPDIPFRLVTNPVFYLDAGTTQAALSGVGALDSAAEREPGIRRVEAATNPYIFMRRGYVERQRSLIHPEDTTAPFAPLPEELSSTDPPPRAGERRSHLHHQRPQTQRDQRAP